MDISSLAPTDSAASASGLGNSKDLDRDAFLKLLVSQLENQDPMEPVKNENFVAQLATFSSLEQLEQVNEGITGLLYMSQADSMVAQLSEGSNLIGKEIGWVDPDSGAAASGIVDSVKVEGGITMLVAGPLKVPLMWVETVQEAGAQAPVDPVAGEGEGDADGAAGDGTEQGA